MMCAVPSQPVASQPSSFASFCSTELSDTHGRSFGSLCISSNSSTIARFFLPCFLPFFLPFFFFLPVFLEWVLSELESERADD